MFGKNVQNFPISRHQHFTFLVLFYSFCCLHLVCYKSIRCERRAASFCYVNCIHRIVWESEALQVNNEPFFQWKWQKWYKKYTCFCKCFKYSFVYVCVQQLHFCFFLLLLYALQFTRGNIFRKLVPWIIKLIFFRCAVKSTSVFRNLNINRGKSPFCFALFKSKPWHRKNFYEFLYLPFLLRFFFNVFAWKKRRDKIFLACKPRTK